MEITIGGNTGQVLMGETMDSPSRTESWILVMASETITLLAVSRVIIRACKIGTPEATKVPKVREKRATVLTLIMVPILGIFSMKVSTTRPPAGVFFQMEIPVKSTIKPRMNTPAFGTMGISEHSMQLSEKLNTNSDSAGSSMPCPANISLNFGTITNIRKIRMPTAMNKMMQG